MIKDVQNVYKDLVGSIRGLFSISGVRSFNDINKEASKYTLELYVLASDNIPVESYKGIAEGVMNKYHALLNVIFRNYVGDNIEQAVDYVMNNLSGQTLRGTVADKVRDSYTALGEAAASQGIEKVEQVKVVFDEAKFGGRGMRTFHVDDDSEQLVMDGTTAHSRPNVQAASSDLKAHELSNNATRQIELQLQGRDAQSRLVTMVIVFSIRVITLSVPSEKLVDALISARDRDILEDYLKLRARKTNLTGMLLNLKELRNEAKRDTSADLSDRILSELLSKRGLVAPTLFTRLSEFKNFTVVLDITDTDRFYRSAGTQLVSSANLAKVFKNFNILSLVVMDTASNRATIFDSDRPTRAMVVDIRSFSKRGQGVEMFERLLNV